METERHDISPDAAMLAEAVQRWFDFHEVERTEQVDRFVCEAAIRIYWQGYRSVDDVATVLIATYFGPLATAVNAPSSSSVH